MSWSYRRFEEDRVETSGNGVLTLNPPINDLSDVRLEPYFPTPESVIAYDGGGGTYKYDHDSDLSEHVGTWFLAWNANTSFAEGVAGQKNVLVKASDWNQFLNKIPIVAFSDASHATNPTDSNSVEWHPTSITPDGRLEFWWFGTPNSTFTKTLGYKSVLDDSTSLFTNYKIQLLLDGTVAFSSNVLSTEASDRVTVSGTSYVPMPLAKPILVNGRYVMPLLLSTLTTATSGLGNANRLTILYSDDAMATWRWITTLLPLDGAAYRTNQWEPWITYGTDGIYRVTARNFGGAVAPVGKGYSTWSSPDLFNWSASTDSPLDVMPMRGETVQDSNGFWYNTLADRALAITNWGSNQRRPVTLWRSRNGQDWLPLAALYPTYLNTWYCCPMIRGGYLYSSTTVGAGIAVSRIPLPPTGYAIGQSRNFSVSSLKPPAIRNGEYKLEAFDYLRVPAVMPAFTGWSIAIVAKTSSFQTSVSLDFLRRTADSTIWGNGLLPSFDGGLEFFIAGTQNGVLTLKNHVRARTDTLSFVGVAFDETNKILRICRKNNVLGDAFQTYECYVRRLVQLASPVNGTAITVDGVTYTFRGTMPGTSATGVASTDTFTAAAHGFTNGQKVWGIVASGLAGITSNSIFYIIAAATNTFQLSLTSGGAAINFTTDGTITIDATLTDVPVLANSGPQLAAIQHAVLANNPNAFDGKSDQMWYTPTSSIKNGVWLFFTEEPGTTAGDGTMISSLGATFDVPKTDFNLNGVNNTSDPSAAGTAQNQAGMNILLMGVWNSGLSSDDFKKLLDDSVDRSGLSIEPYTSSTANWTAANILLDPRNHNPALGAVDSPGHFVTNESGVTTVYGDGAATVEVPGSGDWTLSGNFSFDPIPLSTSFELAAFGDKFNVVKFTITRDSGNNYLLTSSQGGVSFPVTPSIVTPFSVNYLALTGTLFFQSLPLSSSVRPLAQLGRFIADVPIYLTPLRSASLSTRWTNLRGFASV